MLMLYTAHSPQPHSRVYYLLCFSRTLCRVASSVLWLCRRWRYQGCVKYHVGMIVCKYNLQLYKAAVTGEGGYLRTAPSPYTNII